MVGNPDSTRTYLNPFLHILAVFIKDAKTSFSIIVNETNSINLLYINHPRMSRNNPNFHNEFRQHNNELKHQESVRRVALLSFANLCGIISNLIWPSTGKPNNSVEYKRKVDRKNHLMEFFPENCYSNLTKHFRNFLEHNDEKMDEWTAKSKHHNIAFGTGTGIANLDVWLDFHPSTLSVTYYSNGSSKTADLNSMYLDIEKLPPQIVKALDTIMDSPTGWNSPSIRSIIEEE